MFYKYPTDNLLFRNAITKIENGKVLAYKSKPPVNRWFAHTLEGQIAGVPVNGY